MNETQVIELVGGVIAIILGLIDAARSNWQSLTAWAVVVLGAVFVLLAIR